MLRITCTDYNEYCLLRPVLSDYLRLYLGQLTLMPIALNECVNNIFQHAVNKSYILLQLKFHIIANRRLIIRVKHNGCGLDVHQCKAHLKSTTLLENFHAGIAGCGLYLMHEITDCVKFNQSGNEVLMMKKILKDTGDDKLK